MGKDRVYGHEERKDNVKNKGTEKKRSLCPVSKKCGGCQLVDIPYGEQLKQKQRLTELLLRDFGKVMPMIGMDDPVHYRN